MNYQMMIKHKLDINLKLKFLYKIIRKSKTKDHLNEKNGTNKQLIVLNNKVNLLSLHIQRILLYLYKQDNKVLYKVISKVK